MSVCEAMDASATCCGVGDDADDVDVDVKPSLGEEGELAVAVQAGPAVRRMRMSEE